MRLRPKMQLKETPAEKTSIEKYVPQYDLVNSNLRPNNRKSGQTSIMNYIARKSSKWFNMIMHYRLSAISQYLNRIDKSASLPSSNLAPMSWSTGSRPKTSTEPLSVKSLVGTDFILIISCGHKIKRQVGWSLLLCMVQMQINLGVSVLRPLFFLAFRFKVLKSGASWRRLLHGKKLDDFNLKTGMNQRMLTRHYCLSNFILML